MPREVLDDAARYRLLKLLEQRPGISQRELAAEMGVSLGKANYCLHALIERGWVTMVNFSRSGKKAAYFYKLTPKGLSEKAAATGRFLGHKVNEHERITAEIEAIRAELDGADNGQ